MIKYFKDLLKALQDIAENVDNTKFYFNNATTTTSGKILAWEEQGNAFIDRFNEIENRLVEDSRDTGVMIDRKKAVKIVTINGKAERTETFTREASLSKEEKAHYKKYGIVLIIV